MIYDPVKYFTHSILLLDPNLPCEIRERGDEFVREYKKACEEGSIELKLFRLMIVGPKEAGKTCLLKALKGEEFDKNEISTDFIETACITITDPNKDWNESINFTEQLQHVKSNFSDIKHQDFPVLREIPKHWTNKHKMDPIDFFTVWDLAGQSYLFCMHSLFLSPRAVYIVAVDLTKRLDEQVIVREERKDRIQNRDKSLSYLEMIKYWIQTIYSVARSTEDKECKSRIIIVFTKSDKINNPQTIADSYFEEIRDSLFRESNCMSIVDEKFHIVSAKDRKKAKFVMLKKYIYKNAKLTRFDSDLPIRWLDLALKILWDPNPVIGEKEIKEFADRTGCGMDYAQILEFFHSIGVFFFRENIIVKSLSDLLNVILHIILPTNCNDLRYFKGVDQHIERPEKEAILSDNILDAILRYNNLFKVKIEIVQLLKEFGIIIYRNSKEYYIPYLFNEVIPINPEDSDLVLYLYFPDGLAPTSFYFALLSLCISECDKTENSPKLGFNCVEFQWENLTWIIDLLPELKPFIRIIVRGIDFIDSRPDIHSQIFQLEEWTAHIQKELILSGKIAQVVLECPCEQLSKNLIPCVYFENYPKDPFKELHFYCKNKEKYIPWAIYSNKLYHPFKYIPPELGEMFVELHRTKILEVLEVDPLLRPLQKKGLINGEETAKIRKLNKTKKAEFLVDNISNRSDDWAYQFYKILKNDQENQFNIEVRKLYEKFILGFKHSEIPVEDLGFIRYPVRNSPCGICLIINMQTFGGKIPQRKGAELDVSNLQNTFDNLSFEVRTFPNLSKSNLIEKLIYFSEMDHKDYGVFFCIIMSHGNDKNEIYTTDNEAININEIQDYFTPKNCPSLRGKPKIFIIQACRGESKDRGQPEIPDTLNPPSTPSTPKIPARTSGSISHDENLSSKDSDIPLSERTMEKVATHVDFYIAHATFHGYVSYRSRYKGSVFISTLCEVLQVEKYNHHFSDIMIEVRKRVAMIDHYAYLQCPEGIDTLRKQLFIF